eukprot:4740111-Pyramimonas_sp.AAC.1
MSPASCSSLEEFNTAAALRKKTPAAPLIRAATGEKSGAGSARRRGHAKAVGAVGRAGAAISQ